MAWHFYWLVVGILVTWRLTHLLYGEDGPWNLLGRLRQAVGNGFFGSLMDCFYCLSLWVAIPFALLLGRDWKQQMLLLPALSGGAILLERITVRPEVGRLHEEVHCIEGEPEHVLRNEPKPAESAIHAVEK